VGERCFPVGRWPPDPSLHRGPMGQEAVGGEAQEQAGSTEFAGGIYTTA
jgi:hypothetical protein